MYRTNIACSPSGPFAGPMVVSMRPFKPARRDPRDPDHLALSRRAWRAGSSRPSAFDRDHGYRKPDYGDAVPVEADEIPVFWACGVTPQAVIAAAKLPFAITHAPGLMLVTDLRNKQLAVL